MARMAKKIAAEMGDQPGAPQVPQPPRQPMEDAAAAARARIRNANAAVAEPPTASRATGARPRRSERAAREGMAARKPFGAFDQQLSVPEIPGYAQRWFNDVPGRIARAKAAYWEHVKDPVGGGDMQRNVGRGEGSQRGLTAYLMKLPMEFYNEDQQVQQEELEDRLSDIRQGSNQPVEGSYTQDRHKIRQGHG